MATTEQATPVSGTYTLAPRPSRSAAPPRAGDEGARFGPRVRWLGLLRRRGPLGFAPRAHARGVERRASSVERRQQNGGPRRALAENDFPALHQYPELAHRPRAFERVDRPTGAVTGGLTITATTRPVVLELTGIAVDPYGNARVGPWGGATITGKEFALSWSAARGAGGMLVGDGFTLGLGLAGISTPDTV